MMLSVTHKNANIAHGKQKKTNKQTNDESKTALAQLSAHQAGTPRATEGKTYGGRELDEEVRDVPRLLVLLEQLQRALELAVLHVVVEDPAQLRVWEAPPTRTRQGRVRWPTGRTDAAAEARETTGVDGRLKLGAVSEANTMIREDGRVTKRSATGWGEARTQPQLGRPTTVTTHTVHKKRTPRRAPNERREGRHGPAAESSNCQVNSKQTTRHQW